jgi:hypothetical protein
METKETVRKASHSVSFLFTNVVLIKNDSGLFTLGALITIATIAMGPFAQQLIQFEQRVSFFNSNDTSISRGQRYSKGTEYLNNPLDCQYLLLPPLVHLFLRLRCSTKSWADYKPI